MVFIIKENYMFRPIAAIFMFWQFSAKRVLGMLYKTLLAENCQNLKMTAIARNM